MGRRVEVVPAALKHVADIAPRVRECDRAEIWAQMNLGIAEALELAIGTDSSENYACMLDDAVVALFGCVDVSEYTGERSGVLWMIGTDDIYDNADLFHEHTAKWLQLFRARFDHISNWVDSRNTKAVKWIGSVGFDVEDPIPYGPDGVPFHHFEWRAA